VKFLCTCTTQEGKTLFSWLCVPNELPVFVYTSSKRVRRAEAATHEEMESRALLFKDWSRYMGQDRIKDIQIIDMVMTSQLKALEELRLESEELYQAAIQVI
jgi:large subunit ribosomal protein L40